LGPGDFFGKGCLAGQSLRMTTAAALAESAIMRIEKAAMCNTLHDESVFSELFVGTC
jgi:CRP-like cAMP-binding protein